MNPLNSPVELGMRALVLLARSHPDPLDLSWLVLLDHAMLHSGQFDGPPSLHPQLPAQPGELGMKRHLVQEGLEVLMRAGLATVEATGDGLVYKVTQRGSGFVGILEAPYVDALSLRAQWAIDQFASATDVVAATRDITARWHDEFTACTRHLGISHG
ncbi:ABC-three component system middle component 2 [Streptomyces roseifaciens]|uniref:ABC-three component system middle component 2 n=1 Tax=Streptomyces roseifaciens TaxID=1488406 RepID=UPI000A3F9959|nr:ABC-three component system middle component 2 [Streptomyces roseifaciens]